MKPAAKLPRTVTLERLKNQNYYTAHKVVVWVKGPVLIANEVRVDSPKNFHVKEGECLPFLKWGDEYLPLRVESVGFPTWVNPEDTPRRDRGYLVVRGGKQCLLY